MSDNAGLISFAREVIQCAFDCIDLDGSDIQELGVKHGLLVCEPFDPERHSDPDGYAEPGWDWYVFAGPLAAGLSPSQAPATGKADTAVGLPDNSHKHTDGDEHAN